MGADPFLRLGVTHRLQASKMTQGRQLSDFEKEIAQCVKCGACRAHCPVFGVQKMEGRVARGKIALAHALLEGDVAIDDRFLLEMSQCLLCASCYHQCPNKVPTDQIVAAARSEIARRKGLSTFGKGVAAVIRKPQWMNRLVTGSAALSAVLFKKLPAQSGLRLRFPVPYFHPERTLPPLSAQPFLKRHPAFIAGQKGQPTILFFTGCGLNYLYPESATALLHALRLVGATVLVPHEQGCCGLPALSAGASAAVQSLTDQNLAVFRQHRCDVILTACASCHSALTHLIRQPKNKSDIIQTPVKDIFEFLIEQGFIQRLARLPRAPRPVPVGYHLPCHLRNSGHGRTARALLQALPQVAFVEMDGADTCCGLGGTYSVHHYETSRQIGAQKAAAIIASGAQQVATDCPGCILQLQDSINHAGGRQKAVHLIDLIADGLKQE